MPGYPWLAKNEVNTTHTLKKLQVFRDNFGINQEAYPGRGYGSDAELQADVDSIKGKTEMEALIAYLQQLGTHLK
jgi:cytochrome c oxidase cbb3-type subunit 2